MSSRGEAGIGVLYWDSYQSRGSPAKGAGGEALKGYRVMVLNDRRYTRRFLLAAAVLLASWLVLILSCRVGLWSAPAAPSNAPVSAEPEVTRTGLIVNEPTAFPGFTLVVPMWAKDSFLIDMQGNQVHKWVSKTTPSLGAYLLENGDLLRPGYLPQPMRSPGSGAGGLIQQFSWSGQLVWDYKLANKKQLPHHDVCRLPNGNLLVLVWDQKRAEEVVAAGRRSDLVTGPVFAVESLVELKRTGPTTAETVWEWHLWDHLVQELDRTRANYGKVADHPELVDLNYNDNHIAAMPDTNAATAKLRSLGYLDDDSSKPASRSFRDWAHINSVTYNPALDLIAVTSLAFDEVWIIDHGTTRSEAAAHRGGRRGKGGDLLYRWGNPFACKAGSSADQRLFGPHNAHWIRSGLPGEGHLLVFNNGNGRPAGPYSSVEELSVSLDHERGSIGSAGAGYGKADVVWSYTHPTKSEFFSMFFSGAQRLPNGNTFICSGVTGTLVEVTQQRSIAWKYIVPDPSSSPEKGQVADSCAVFRAYRYGGDFPAFDGKRMAPGMK
jgi:hypothetical protein